MWIVSNLWKRIQLFHNNERKQVILESSFEVLTKEILFRVFILLPTFILTQINDYIFLFILCLKSIQ